MAYRVLTYRNPISGYCSIFGQNYRENIFFNILVGIPYFDTFLHDGDVSFA